MIMPSMTGKDVSLEFIKINPDAKVIIASGYTADNSLADMLKLGAVDTLKKPCRLASLKAHIERYCNMSNCKMNKCYYQGNVTV